MTGVGEVALFVILKPQAEESLPCFLRSLASLRMTGVVEIKSCGNVYIVIARSRRGNLFRFLSGGGFLRSACTSVETTIGTI